jgi:hypothetical protein
MDIPLSASEEITLRRVHYAIAKPDAMIARDVERLLELALISRQGSHLVLTEAGQARVAALPSPDQQLEKLRDLLAKSAR